MRPLRNYPHAELKSRHNACTVAYSSQDSSAWIEQIREITTRYDKIGQKQ